MQSTIFQNEAVNTLSIPLMSGQCFELNKKHTERSQRCFTLDGGTVNDGSWRTCHGMAFKEKVPSIDKLEEGTPNAQTINKSKDI